MSLKPFGYAKEQIERLKQSIKHIVFYGLQQISITGPFHLARSDQFWCNGIAYILSARFFSLAKIMREVGENISVRRFRL